MRYALSCGVLLVVVIPAAAQDMPLSQILIDGEGWKVPERAVLSFPKPTEARTNAGIYQIEDKKPTPVVMRGETQIPLPGLVRPSCLAAWPDQGTLVVGDAGGKHLWVYRIEPDGSLTAGEPYYPLRMKPGQTASGVTALTMDMTGRLYACTPLGVQVFDPTGRLSGVLLKPHPGTPTALAFGSPDRSMLYVLYAEKIYTRKTKAKGLPTQSVALTTEVYNLLKPADQPMTRDRVKMALWLAEAGIELDPKSADAYCLRGLAHAKFGQHEEAVADFDKALALDPKRTDIYNERGSEYFKLGKFKESIADFDKYLKRNAEETSGHWKRGISYYYAGRYDDGRKQFEGYEKVDTNDVENAVWRYLCMARAEGVEKARASILKIGNDRRVPMMQVYALYSGKIEPEDVLAAAEAGKPAAEELNRRLFYTHLYLGLYQEVAGDKKRALEHLTKAEEHKIGHYMWDVAHVHAQLLRKK